ncbi:MAG: hypothetical protein RIK87_14935 [Fuerstiella sp.]
MSSTTPNRLRSTEPLSEDVQATDDIGLPPAESAEASADRSQNADSLSSAEARLLQNEKLTAIRAAIDAGHYDSDELLAKAMNRMRAAIEKETDPQ